MKEFNIKKIAGELIVYRNGKTPKEIFFPTTSKLVKVITIDDQGDVLWHYENGSYHSFGTSNFDLFFKK